MDETTVYAACAVMHGDANQAEQWFRVVAETHQGLDEGADWNTFRAGLQESAAANGIPAETVELFAEYLEQQSAPLDVIAEMSAQGPEQLLAAYQEWISGSGAEQVGPDGSDAAGPVAEDEGAWNAFLAENGPRWDGTEENWQAFRDWFAWEAAASSVGTTAEAFLQFAEASSDKREVFEQYGIAPAVGPDDAVPADGEPGAATELAAYSDEQIATFVGDLVAEVDSGAEENPDGFEEGDLAALFGDDGTLDVDQAVEMVADPVITQFREEYPQFAEMSDEEIRGLLAEVIAEEAGAAQPA